MRRALISVGLVAAVHIVLGYLRWMHAYEFKRCPDFGLLASFGVIVSIVVVLIYYHVTRKKAQKYAEWKGEL